MSQFCDKIFLTGYHAPGALTRIRGFRFHMSSQYAGYAAGRGQTRITHIAALRFPGFFSCKLGRMETQNTKSECAAAPRESRDSSVSYETDLCCDNSDACTHACNDDDSKHHKGDAFSRNPPGVLRRPRDWIVTQTGRGCENE